MKVRVGIYSPVEQEMSQLRWALSQFSSLVLDRDTPDYPLPQDVVRSLRVMDPDILFLSTSDPVKMEAVVSQAVEHLPHIQIILVDSTGDAAALLRAMRLGVRECLTAPYGMDDVRGVIERSLARRANTTKSVIGTNDLYTFLPARPGVGASVLAMQAALNLPLDGTQRALLLDADLEAGSIQFQLQLENPYSIVDAIERVDELDDNLWPQLVSTIGNLDIMQSGDAGSDYRPEPGRVEALIEFARRQYSVIVVDLPSSLNRLSVELLQQSKAIFLVTTPEIASLHMVRRRARQLQDLGVSQSVKLVVNRLEKRPNVTIDHVKEAVQLPVYSSFNNDYAAVQKMIISASPLDRSSNLGRQISSFATALLANAPAAPAPKKRRFLEVFSLQR